MQPIGKPIENANPGDESSNDGEFRDDASNPEVIARAERLHLAVRVAGGNKVVAERLGVPTSSLGRWLAGRDMKAQTLIDLARACGVDLGWLASGVGDGPPPKRPRGFSEAPASNFDHPPAAQPAATSAPLSIFDEPLLARCIKETLDMGHLIAPGIRPPSDWVATSAIRMYLTVLEERHK